MIRQWNLKVNYKKKFLQKNGVQTTFQIIFEGKTEKINFIVDIKKRLIYNLPQTKAKINFKNELKHHKEFWHKN